MKTQNVARSPEELREKITEKIAQSPTKGTIKAIQVKKVMTTNVETTRPDAMIKEAARRMRTRDIGSLPVIEDHRIIGMLTDRDITIGGTAEGKDPNRTTVRDILPRQEIVSCFEDQEIHEAAKMMEEHEVRRLPVLNRDNQLVGILSLSDLAFKTKDDRLYGEVLAHVSEPFTATVD